MNEPLRVYVGLKLLATGLLVLFFSEPGLSSQKIAMSSMIIIAPFTLFGIRAFHFFDTYNIRRVFMAQFHILAGLCMLAFGFKAFQEVLLLPPAMEGSITELMVGVWTIGALLAILAGGTFIVVPWILTILNPWIFPEDEVCADEF